MSLELRVVRGARGHGLHRRNRFDLPLSRFPLLVPQSNTRVSHQPNTKNTDTKGYLDAVLVDRFRNELGQFLLFHCALIHTHKGPETDIDSGADETPPLHSDTHRSPQL